MENYSEFGNEYYDVILNLSCPGSPSHIKAAGNKLVKAVINRDNEILKYLENNDSLYVNMSSGIVHEMVESPYKKAKMHLEKNHRKHQELNIIDLRLYSYFSRYISLKSGHLMAGIINCIKNNTVFNAISLELVRDYIHPEDLADIILNLPRGNAVYEIGSKKPVSLSEILNYCSKMYDLKYILKYKKSDLHAGVNLAYYPKTVAFNPIDTSMETIKDQLNILFP
jgi:nucleoside-diphosphate-sugar epimerase